MKRIALGVQYDGAPWRGWQTQPGGCTVQDALEAALQKFALVPIKTTCAGRTDAGVHAIEQVVHFDTERTRDMQSWVRGLNTFLPASIAVSWAVEIPPELDDPDNGFHARFSAMARRYYYVLYNHPVRSPLLAGKAGWAFRPLALEPMRTAAQALLGEHDFSAFRASSCQAKSPIKTMYEVSVEQKGDLFLFSLRGNAFLHHMVRNIVGSLVYVGTGTHSPQWFAEVLAAGERRLAAPTFMPDGLYLAKIDYPDKWALPHQPLAMPWL